MILEFLAGEHPAARRAGEWLEEHPVVALAIFLFAGLMASARW